jgi:hypothetical protein
MIPTHAKKKVVITVAEKTRKLNDVELVEACRSYREKTIELLNLGKIINEELEKEAILVEHNGLTFAVSAGPYSSDVPAFRAIRVPQQETV